jgi:hypothetical protein
MSRKKLLQQIVFNKNVKLLKQVKTNSLSTCKLSLQLEGHINFKDTKNYEYHNFSKKGKNSIASSLKKYQTNA